MAKTYSSVVDMVKDITQDKEFVQELEDLIARQSVGRELSTQRCKKGMTQGELAKKLGWPQSKVSKLEHTDDDKLRIGDVNDYLLGLGIRLTLHMHEEGPAVACIKYHALEIKKYLDQLAKLAKKDDTIFEGVTDFYCEYLYNALRIFVDSASKLPEPQRLVEATSGMLARGNLAICPPVDQEDVREPKSESKPQPELEQV